MDYLENAVLNKVLNNGYDSDICIQKKVIVIYDNFNEVYSHHDVEKFQIVDGKLRGSIYYIFKHQSGIPVSLYNYHDFISISKYLDIKEDECIIYEPKTHTYVPRFNLVPYSNRLYK